MSCDESLLIRYDEYGELEQVNQLRRQVNDLHIQGRPDIFRSGFSPQLQKQVYDAFENKNEAVIVAKLTDQIVGFAVLKYIWRPETLYQKERRFCELEEFGVDEAHRRQHIASKLIEFIKTEAGKKGFSKIELNMWAFNESALLFYEAIGFETYRRYMELPIHHE